MAKHRLATQLCYKSYLNEGVLLIEDEIQAVREGEVSNSPVALPLPLVPLRKLVCQLVNRKPFESHQAKPGSKEGGGRREQRKREADNEVQRCLQYKYIKLVRFLPRLKQ